MKLVEVHEHILKERLIANDSFWNANVLFYPRGSGTSYVVRAVAQNRFVAP